jgi:hypothetical protein
LIGKAKKNEAIQIEYLPKTDKRDERVKITFGTLQYDLALIRVDTIRKTPKTPTINLPVKIAMRSAKFRQTIALVSEITDEITFTVPAGEDKLTAEGTGEMAETHILTTIENGDLLKFEDERMDENKEKDDRAMVSRFPVEELDKISKIVANKGEVTLQMDTDYPCKVITSFADDQGSIEYLLAPRVDD